MSILARFRVRADMRKNWRPASPNVQACKADAEQLLTALEAVLALANAATEKQYFAQHSVGLTDTYFDPVMWKGELAEQIEDAIAGVLEPTAAAPGADPAASEQG